MLESEQVVNNVCLAGFHSKETKIHCNSVAHKTGDHREKSPGTWQSAVEEFT